MTPPASLREVSDRPVSPETTAIPVRTFDDRMSALESRMDSLESATGQILELVQGFQAGIKALELLARIVKPVSAIAVAIAAVWAAMKGFKL